MKKNKIIVLLVILMVLFGASQISAGPRSNFAIGVQGGFLATGIVVDVALGPLNVNAGVNYPVGWTYVTSLAGSDDLDFLFPAFFTVTADVTTSIPLGNDFALKVGASTIGLTDFQSGIFGVVGACIKGEYWIPYRDTGLFVNLNVPVMLYGFTGGTPNVLFSPWLPLAGLLTTTAGVLWSF